MAEQTTRRKPFGHASTIYREQTQPLLDIYDGRGLTVGVDGMGDVDEVTERILTILSVITIKSRREFAKMQKAGACVAAVHAAVREAAVSRGDPPRVGRDGSPASSLRTGALHLSSTIWVRIPATLCLSPNDVIVHGIPGEYQLQEGDILSVDAGAIFEGFHGDAAFTDGCRR